LPLKRFHRANRRSLAPAIAIDIIPTYFVQDQILHVPRFVNSEQISTTVFLNTDGSAAEPSSAILPLDIGGTLFDFKIMEK
tara:strand:- start:1735 stop:1977 length:243 start_codon:yes stop_codon:yes gene_type:complete